MAKSRITDEQKAQAEAEIAAKSKSIDYFITEYTLEILALKLERGQFRIPGYQRAFTWDPKRKRRFIESLLMGLPIPPLFFWQVPESGGLEVVDGSQRLRTISEFFDDGLKLSGLLKLPAVNGFRFSDLSDSRQLKIKDLSIRGIVLSDRTDAEARFDLFDRVNTGSLKATNVEIRRGALPGPFTDLIIELSEDPRLRRLAPNSPKKIKLRAYEELVTRFFAYSDGLEEYNEDVSGFLFRHLEKMNAAAKGNPDIIGSYRGRFHATMAFIEEAIPRGFRRTPERKATPRVRFEALAIGTFLALHERPELKPSAVNTASWIDSEEFESHTRSDAANVTKKLKGRIQFVRDALLSALR